MDVIVDANAILADPRMQGNYFSELFAYLRRTGSRLVVPTVIFQEVSARYPELLAGHLRKAISAWANLRHLSIKNIKPLPDVDVRQAVRDFKRRLFKPAKGVKVLLYRKMSEAHIREVLRRGIRRIPPASPTGEELRDVTLWLVALQFAKETRQPLALITKDDGFANESKDGLHPRLLEESNRAQMKLHFYRELRDFVVGNALAQEAIDEASFFRYVPKDRAEEIATAMLLRLATNRGQVQTAEVSQLAFSSGQKYKVGENSYFVETSLSGEGKISILETAWTTFVNVGANFPLQGNLPLLGPVSMRIATTAPQNLAGGVQKLFGTLNAIDYNTLMGGSVPLSTLAGNLVAPPSEPFATSRVFQPTSSEKPYRCRFRLQLTARVVNEELEAVEPEGIQIEELAAIEPEPPQTSAVEAGEAAKSKGRPRRRHVVPRPRR